MKRALALGASLAAVAAVAALTTPAAAAPAAPATPTAPAQATSPYAGSGQAELVDVEASLAGQDVADLALPQATTDVDSVADPRSEATAANLRASLLGALDLSTILSTSSQTAPPDNPEPSFDQLLGVPASPLLDLGLSTATTWARWPGDGVCVAPGAPVARSTVETANLSLLDVPGLGRLLTVVNGTGGVTATDSVVTTETVPGQAGRALQSVSSTQVTSVVLFQGTPAEISINVLATPTLTATATGTPGGATAEFSAPLVTITSPSADIPDLIRLAPADLLTGVLNQLTGGLETVLDTLLGGAGIVNLDIVLGEDTLEVEAADDGTSVTASAAAVVIDLEVLEAIGEPLVDAHVAVAPLAASASVPAGGISCPDGENPLRDLHKDVSAADVAPGSRFDYTLTVPNRGPCALTDVVVTDVITGPFESITADPPPTSIDGGTLRWDVGDLAVNETRTFTVTVDVAGNAAPGTVFGDNLTATGRCEGEEVTHTVNLPLPRVTDGFSGPCDLSLSNKRASHLEVTPGQTFNYFVHVFNRGAEACNGASVTDTLDDRLSFVACTDGCTHEGQQVTWTGQDVPGGGSVTLTVTVQVDEDATGTLKNTAVIDPDGSAGDGQPTTVSVDGPQITDRSVPAPADPPRLLNAGGPLPKTGQDDRLAQVLTVAAMGLGVLALRRRQRTAG
jgi:uncharacterized repeat protein (TIGR01451 family)/LPXTG-motif cell wall-anchored protein